jgi:hypothetical protein
VFDGLTLSIVGLPLLLLSTYLVYQQLVDVRRIAASQNNIQLTMLFLRDSNTAIVKTIEANAADGKTQILKKNGGEFSSTQLDNGDVPADVEIGRQALPTLSR